MARIHAQVCTQQFRPKSFGYADVFEVQRCFICSGEVVLLPERSGGSERSTVLSALCRTCWLAAQICELLVVAEGESRVIARDGLEEPYAVFVSTEHDAARAYFSGRRGGGDASSYFAALGWVSGSLRPPSARGRFIAAESEQRPSVVGAASLSPARHATSTEPSRSHPSRSRTRRRSRCRRARSRSRA